MNKESKVAILLCTYNGSKFIRQQLDSLINQTHSDWVIFASDDGSKDDTLAILREYQNKVGKDKLVIVNGPGKGFAWNFISLLDTSGDNFNFYTFSDQDDEWQLDKLSRGIEALHQVPDKKPAVHCGRTLLVDEKNEAIGFSPLFRKPPSFRNALIQSIAGGNTMMLNRTARNIINKTPRWYEIISHDWWIYIVISGCDGVIIYDEKPTIRYRQHTNNIIGSNISWMGRIQRIFGLLDGKFRLWIQKNLDALNAMDVPLSLNNKAILENFIVARNAALPIRLAVFYKLRMYRQTFCGTLALVVAIFLKKI